MTKLYQPGIFDGVPAVARFVVFSLSLSADADVIRQALVRLSPLANGSEVVLGVEPSLVAALGAEIPGLHEFPAIEGRGVKVPSTPGTLWCWVRGDDLGDLLHLTRKVQKSLAPAFVWHVVDAFRHALGESGHGRDLTGYEDGTENPIGEGAELAAAHVKRTAQEDFDPPAFMLRRSMPWMMSMQAGLMFVAFGESLYAFEAQMRRMAGQEDGIVDAMLAISRPVNGAYFWCPPMRDGKLDLRRLGL